MARALQPATHRPRDGHGLSLRAGDDRFDQIVVDPPAFAKSKREKRGAQRGYRDLNRNAIRLLAPGGLFVTCSCSHHVSGPEFEDVLRQSSSGLPFRVLMKQRIMAGEDHPAWVGLPVRRRAME